MQFSIIFAPPTIDIFKCIYNVEVVIN